MNQNELNESNTRAIRALFGKSSNGTHGLPVDAVVAAPVEVARTEGEAPRAVGTARSRRRRPVVAVRAGAEEARAVAVAGGRKEDAPVRVCALARHQVPGHAVGGDPRGGAIADESGKFRSRRHAPVAAPMNMRRVIRRHKIGSRVDPALRLKRRIVFAVGRT